MVNMFGHFAHCTLAYLSMARAAILQFNRKFHPEIGPLMENFSSPAESWSEIFPLGLVR
jgi:hypothetical protein